MESPQRLREVRAMKGSPKPVEYRPFRVLCKECGTIAESWHESWLAPPPTEWGGDSTPAVAGISMPKRWPYLARAVCSAASTAST